MNWTRIRRPAALLAATVLAATASACGGGESSTETGDGTPQEGGSLTFALEEETAGYNPGFAGSLAFSGSNVFQALFETITIYDDDGAVIPRFAESVEPNEDFTVWTVKIPADAKYSSGTAVKAADFESMFKDYYVAEGASTASTFASVASVKAVDDTTIEFETTTPYASFPAVLVSFYVFNPDVREKYGDKFAEHPDGTGPFMLSKWERDNQLKLEANPNYPRKDEDGRQLPYLDDITLRIIPSGPTRTATLESGGIDGFQSVQPSTLQQATTISGATTDVSSAGGYGWFLNTQAAPTDDIRVRQALAYGMDRSAIIAAQGADEILTPLDQYYGGPDNPYRSQAASDAFPKFDTEAAQELVEEYINDPDRSDGKDVGDPLTLQVNYIAGDDQSTAAVQVVEQEWGAAGVEVEPNALDSTAWVQAALEGNTQAFWFGWSGTDPAYNYARTYADPKVAPTNWTKLDDPELRDMIDELKRCADVECGIAANDLIAVRMAEQLAVLPIQATPQGFVYSNSKVGGAQFMSGAKSGFNAAIDWAHMWAK
jgi:peptide/nickel transport system substrate-binding protein